MAIVPVIIAMHASMAAQQNAAAANAARRRQEEEDRQPTPAARKAAQEGRRIQTPHRERTPEEVAQAEARSRQHLQETLDRLERENRERWKDKPVPDRREGLRNVLIRLSQASYLIPSAEGRRAALFSEHPDRFQMVQQYGHIWKHQVAEAIQTLMGQKGFFSRKRLHETEIFKAVSPEHWDKPIVQEQVLEALEELIWRAKSETGYRMGFKRAKDGGLWVYCKK